MAAVLAADVAGYSRLMGDDEEATIAALGRARAVFREAVTSHDGRVVDTAGDSVLAVFESIIEAVRCALAVQETLATRNADVPEDRRMMFRIGVHFGDIVEQEDGTIYGDGVNIAARLEGLGEPGGLTVSGSVHEHIEGKLGIGLSDLGEQEVKNIARPVRAWRVAAGGGSSSAVPLSRKAKRPLALVAALFVVVVGGLAAWQMDLLGTPDTTDISEDLLAMPTGPSIAVLPFENLSGDAEDEYFSDGLTDDLITELARFRGFHVRARNTTAQYKGQAVDVSQVGLDLGVRYVLEGSVRRAEDRVRINVKLIETSSGDNIWVNRFDRDLTDIFAVQDEITESVIGVIASGAGSVLRIAEAEYSSRKHPDDLEAYDLVLQARSKPSYLAPEYAENKALMERALALDPDYARAREEYAWLLLYGWIFRFEDSLAPPAELKENAIRALELDPSDALTRRTAAYGYFLDKQIELFRRHADRALEMAPNNAEILVQLGMAFSFIGEWDKGLALVDKARALNAVTAAGWYNSAKFYPLYLQGRYEEANEIMRDHPLQGQAETIMKYVMTYGQLGDQEQAMENWRRCLEVEPDWSAQRMIDIFELWNFPEEHVEQFMEGVWKAGIPRPAS
jgi:adenylate cyclase